MSDTIEILNMLRSGSPTADLKEAKGLGDGRTSNMPPSGLDIMSSWYSTLMDKVSVAKDEVQKETEELYGLAREQKQQSATREEGIYIDGFYSPTISNAPKALEESTPITAEDLKGIVLEERPSSPSKAPTHIISKGDNLTKIAKANNTSVDSILELNPNIKGPDYTIKIDQEIMLPRSTPQSESDGLMSRVSRKRGPILAESRTTDAFYLNIGTHAETDHGSTPQITNDSREANKPDAEKSRDVGFGHKITAAENTSGKIHGITFKNKDGTYKPLNETEKRTILKADMKIHQDSARASGWDAKLKKIGTSWDQLDEPYQNALTSLAYNVGGSKAGKSWNKVLTAAKNRDVGSFALGMRRKDAGKNTAGMDNRVAKELYFAGLISSLTDVSSQLPLADSRSGIPVNKETE